MIKSSKPRRQRLFRYTAPMHERQKFVHAHIDKQLREKLKLKNRTIQLSKGDTVKVMAGSNKGTAGKVTAINLKSGRIYIDTIKRKNAKGKESGVPINSSNVYITDIDLSDKIRAAKLNLKQQPKSKGREEERAGEDARKGSGGISEKHADDAASVPIQVANTVVK